MTNTTVDDVELNDILGRFVADLGSTAAAGNIVIGDLLGLYRALAEAGPLTAAELADHTGTRERYVREWLRGQAAGQLVSYGPDTDRYWMTAAQALAFADPNGLVLPGAFQMALACFDDRSAIVDRFRSGGGFAWGEHSTDVAVGCERFFRPGYVANLVSAWLPAVDGLVERLQRGIAVAVVGCGLGASTRILAETYPASTVVGYDNDPGSIELAEKLTTEAGLGDRVHFAVAAAAEFPGNGLGLVTTFDCLHDMGDPAAAARNIRRALADDGIWMIVEPYAGDTVADNLTPVGRLYYSLSTFLCVPHAIAEGAPDAMGNQAGEQPIARVIEAGGFSRFQRVAETPFNIVYEVRP
jgi:SAM-dependent methyltransferase